MKGLHIITFILLVVGGLNWLLVGALGWDIGNLFGGQANIISRIIYILVGVATVLELVSHKKSCKACKKDGASMPAMGGVKATGS